MNNNISIIETRNSKIQSSLRLFPTQNTKYSHFNLEEISNSYHLGMSFHLNISFLFAKVQTDYKK